ncbi:hypothetical protein FB451DRAFT_1173084 [Mycena latifolia]|nr:hypothetical protein FB451DRAFT_1173084 [Mycena latifolia]
MIGIFKRKWNQYSGSVLQGDPPTATRSHSDSPAHEERGATLSLRSLQSGALATNLHHCRLFAACTWIGVLHARLRAALHVGTNLRGLGGPSAALCSIVYPGIAHQISSSRASYSRLYPRRAHIRAEYFSNISLWAAAAYAEHPREVSVGEPQIAGESVVLALSMRGINWWWWWYERKSSDQCKSYADSVATSLNSPVWRKFQDSVATPQKLAARCARGDALGPEPIRYRPAHQPLRPVFLWAREFRALKRGGLDSYFFNPFPLSASSGVSSIRFVVDGKLEDQQGKGFAVQDDLVFANSSCSAPAGGKGTFDIAGRKDVALTRVYLEQTSRDSTSRPIIVEIDMMPKPVDPSKAYAIWSADVSSTFESYTIGAEVGGVKVTRGMGMSLIQFGECSS